jgi:hypothetical protein
VLQPFHRRAVDGRRVEQAPIEGGLVRRDDLLTIASASRSRAAVPQVHAFHSTRTPPKP